MTIALAFLVGLLPAADALAVDASGAAALAVLCIALTVLARVSSHGIVLRCGALATTPAAATEPPPRSTARVTDPVHHPLRPRAPGPA